MTHTPGPWHVSTILPDKAKGHTFEPTIALIAHSVQFDAAIRIADIPDVSAEDWTEQLATAMLIAEAPEMFLLLRATFEDMGGNLHERAKALMARLGVTEQQPIETA